jgi:hypothetical protein
MISDAYALSLASYLPLASPGIAAPHETIPPIGSARHSAYIG